MSHGNGGPDAARSRARRQARARARLERVPDALPGQMTLLGGGLRLDSDVTHMCPACGIPAEPLCSVCTGTGNITDVQLAAYQRKLWADAGGLG